MNIFSKIFTALLLTSFNVLVYAQPESFFELDNGYRWDKIYNRVTFEGPTLRVKGSTQILKNINSYQLGGKGQWAFCNSAFIRASGHYGWVWDARYDEADFLGKAKGNTYDANGSLGYYFCLSSGAGLAPIIGWSFNQFNLKGTDISVPIDGRIHHLSDIKANQKFTGPFVGIDLFLSSNSCFDLILGYEFHYAEWHGDRLIQGHEFGDPPFGSTTAYSNKRHMHRVLGNVFKIDASYDFWDCWNIGLELKYQFFSGDYGKYKQTKVPLISLASHANVDDLEWHSFASMIHIGRKF